MESTEPQAKKPRNARAGKAPAFQFYAADYLADEATIGMTLAQIGAYTLLLAIHFREGSIPANPDRIARLIRCQGQSVAFRELWRWPLSDCFQPHPTKPDRLVQGRMFEDLKVAQQRHLESVETGVLGGRKSAKLRAEKQGPLETNPTSSSASASASAEIQDSTTVGGNSDSAVAPPAPPVALAPMTRKRPGPLPPDLQRRTTDLISEIEGYEANQNGDRFSPGQWWGKSLNKLGRQPAAMLATLERLGSKLRARDRPESPWAYCDGTYEEIAADTNAARAERENEALKHAPTIFDG